MKTAKSCLNYKLCKIAYISRYDIIGDMNSKEGDYEDQ